MSCRSILIVEDDDDIRSHLAMALQMEQFKVLTAENGQIALDILLGLSKEDLPGCIILDLMMPVMDGNKFMEVIEKHHHIQIGSIPILIATAKGSNTALDTIPQAVARIQKPFDLDELFDSIDAHYSKPI